METRFFTIHPHFRPRHTAVQPNRGDRGCSTASDSRAGRDLPPWSRKPFPFRVAVRATEPGRWRPLAASRRARSVYASSAAYVGCAPPSGGLRLTGPWRPVRPQRHQPGGVSEIQGTAALGLRHRPNHRSKPNTNKERRAKAARRSLAFYCPRPQLLGGSTKESLPRKTKPSDSDFIAIRGSVTDAFFGASPVVASALGIRSGATPRGRFHPKPSPSPLPRKEDASTLLGIGHFYFALTRICLSTF
jgi:hypothetical protein